MEMSAIKALTADDMQAVNQLIITRLSSDVVLINQIGAHIVHSGGKRLRPMLVLLAARALGYQGKQHVDLAAIIEFIHTATLLHDDVVDESDKRRNEDTANAVWGNAASVLTGDFLYSRSFEMMVDVGQMRVMEILSRATNQIAEGEVLQLLNCNDPDTSETAYMEVIQRKTAVLFEAGCRLGALIANGNQQQEQALASYGRHLGTAFQLVDDALDYMADAEHLGKNLGDDLAEGKPTLPLIHAMQQADETDHALIREAIETGGLEHIDKIVGILKQHNSIAYTLDQAQHQANLAKQSLEGLPESPQRQAMISLADYSVSRTY